jgi:hypothetical protein
MNVYKGGEESFATTVFAANNISYDVLITSSTGIPDSSLILTNTATGTPLYSMIVMTSDLLCK